MVNMEENKEQLEYLYNNTNKRGLIELIFGNSEMESYINEWVKFKMETFDDFYYHLDSKNKEKYKKFSNELWLSKK